MIPLLPLLHDVYSPALRVHPPANITTVLVMGDAAAAGAAAVLCAVVFSLCAFFHTLSRVMMWGPGRASNALHLNAITNRTHTNRTHPSIHTPQQ